MPESRLIPLRYTTSRRQAVVSHDIGDSAQAAALLRREITASVNRHHRTLAQIAARAGVCRETVSRLYYGETRHPRFTTVALLFRAFGYQLDARR